MADKVISFDERGGRKIVKAVRAILGQSIDETGRTSHKRSYDSRGFWARITGHDDGPEDSGAPIAGEARYKYSWREQWDTWDVDLLIPHLEDKSDDDGGRSGTTDTDFALNVLDPDANQNIVPKDTIVWMEMTIDDRGEASWRFTFDGPAARAIQLTGQIPDSGPGGGLATGLYEGYLLLDNGARTTDDITTAIDLGIQGSTISGLPGAKWDTGGAISCYFINTPETGPNSAAAASRTAIASPGAVAVGVYCGTLAITSGDNVILAPIYIGQTLPSCSLFLVRLSGAGNDGAGYPLYDLKYPWATSVTIVSALSPLMGRPGTGLLLPDGGASTVGSASVGVAYIDWLGAIKLLWAFENIAGATGSVVITGVGTLNFANGVYTGTT